MIGPQDYSNDSGTELVGAFPFEDELLNRPPAASYRGD